MEEGPSTCRAAGLRSRLSPCADSATARSGCLPCDGLLLDLDGVIWLDGALLSGVREVLAAVRARGLPVLYPTNDSRSSRAQLAERLTRGDVPANAEQVLTSGRAAAQLVAAEQPPEAPVLVVGSTALHHEAEAVGLRLVDPRRPHTARAALVGADESFNYEQLAQLTLAAHHGAALYATSRETTYPGPYGPRPATGAVLAAVEAAAGRRAVAAGKSAAGMYRTARRLLPGAEQLVIVSDRLDTDIAGAVAADIPGVLVLTGSATQDDLASTTVVPDPAGLPWATSASISASLPLPLRSSSVQPSRRRLLV